MLKLANSLSSRSIQLRNGCQASLVMKWSIVKVTIVITMGASKSVAMISHVEVGRICTT